MRGYFAIGVEGISKQMNFGNLVRSAHGFGAHFVFTVDGHYRVTEVNKSDTSKSDAHLPIYHWESPSGMILPQDCQLVGVELIDEAVDLPSFRHPLKAAYILGPEKGSLSDDIIAKCAHVVKIPTTFCINVAMAGAIVMYDRVRSMGRFAERPVGAGGPVEPLPEHAHGGRFTRRGGAMVPKSGV